MKKRLLLALLAAGIGFHTYGQNEFYNDGAQVYVQGSGGLIYVQGAVTNDDQGGNIGRIFNSGDIMLTGNWTNTSTSNVFQALDPGTTTFLGNNALQTIGGTQDTYFNNLTLNKPGGTREVRLLRNSLSDGIFNLTQDFMNTQTFTFLVANPNPAAIVRVGAVAPNVNNSTTEGYVTSTVGSTGRLARATSNLFPGATYFYPLGTSARFRPISIRPTSVGNNAYTAQFVDIPTPNTNLKAPTLATINPFWYHFIERQAPAGSPEDIRIYWDFAGDAICDINYLTMSEWNNALWADLSPTTSVNPGGTFLGYTTKSGYPGTYPTPWFTNMFALAGQFITPGAASCVFPVELLNLEANPVGSNIRLDWATATENNNAGFEVHRSSNGLNFEYKGFVNGSGTTTTENQYQFIDTDVQPGVMYYYFLNQRDFNGGMSRSNIVYAMVLESGQVFVSELYPNPAHESVNLSTQFEGETDVKVNFYNALGQQVLTKSWVAQSGRQDHTFDVSRLAQGTYMVTVQAGTESFTRKLVVE